MALGRKTAWLGNASGRWRIVISGGTWCTRPWADPIVLPALYGHPGKPRRSRCLRPLPDVRDPVFAGCQRIGRRLSVESRAGGPGVNDHRHRFRRMDADTALTPPHKSRGNIRPDAISLPGGTPFFERAPQPAALGDVNVGHAAIRGLVSFPGRRRGRRDDCAAVRGRRFNTRWHLRGDCCLILVTWPTLERRLGQRLIAGRPRRPGSSGAGSRGGSNPVQRAAVRHR